jgi:hypothetical protein
MTSKDTQSQEEPGKSTIRTIPVDDASLEKVKALQAEFSERTAGGRISQIVIANRAIAKLTLADILPQLEAA